MPRSVRLLVVCLIAVFIAPVCGEIALVPQPVAMRVDQGSLSLPGPIVIRAAGGARDAAELLAEELSARTGLRVQLRSSSTRADIILTLDDELAAHGPEAYFLSVGERGVRIAAPAHAGLVWGGQTLLQLLQQGDGWSLPRVAITDYPRFPWRGVMLDCSRTFQSLDYLRKTMDRMACYKLNVLHLHLIDDQGWRLEIRSHPELTERGAWFEPESGEPASHQGFYSQAEMRALVRYAARRGIIIVPEIEMPGHSMAALACHPELSCAGGPFRILPFHQTRGIQRDIFCAGNDDVFNLMEDVLAEVVALFPSRYIHIGGDEAPKALWKACPRCQARIREEALANEAELQSYFIKRVEKMIPARGRVLIGWDEILEGGLAPNAAVMSWRGTRGGIAAAREGHPVIMTPRTHCYFDYTYQRIDTATAYRFEPIPDVLTEAEGKLILGVQANFWSHIDREPELVDRQLYPRLLGIAERAWSPRYVRDYEAFAVRARAHRPALDRMGISYAVTPLTP